MEATNENVRSLLIKSPVIFSQLYAFNYTPASYLHPSRRPQFFNGALPDITWEDPRVWEKLSVLMLQQLELNDQVCMEFPHPKWSLALLPSSRMRRMAQHIGAIVLGARIRSSLAREQVLKWKEQLGHETFQFVMNSARLLPSIRIDDAAFDTNNVEQIGYDLICTSFIEAPTQMRQLVLLKMPVQTQASNMSVRLINQMVQSVLVTLETEWHSSFTTIRN